MIVIRSFFLAFLFMQVHSRPQPQDDADAGEPMAFNFEWEVSEQDAEPNGIYARHEEKAEESNPARTDGEYRVWLPDGRLMIVSYYVDGESGFVPTITYEDNFSPSFTK